MTHNTVFNVEFSNDNHVADPFLKRLIAEFHHQQHSPSADVAKTAVTLKHDALLFLAWNTNVLEKRVTMEIFYEPVTLLRTLIQIGRLSHKTTIDYHLTLRCTKHSCQKSKLLTDDVLLIGSVEIFDLNNSIETIQADCSSWGERGQKHENIIRVQNKRQHKLVTNSTKASKSKRHSKRKFKGWLKKWVDSLGRYMNANIERTF